MSTYILDKERAAALNLDPAEYNVIIRVTDPKNDFPPLIRPEIYTDMLQLQFYDLENDATGLYIFNQTHLDRLLEFFSRHRNCRNMVVHCDKGESRSAAIAIGWLLFNDTKSNIYKIYHDKRYFPNRRIVEFFYRHFGADLKQIAKWEAERGF